MITDVQLRKLHGQYGILS